MFKYLMIVATAIFVSTPALADLNVNGEVTDTYKQIINKTPYSVEVCTDVNVPGDKLVYDDFQLTFIVDENMENYMSIHNWLVGLTYPESVQQFTDQIAGDMKNQFSEGTLLILNSSFQTQTQVKFRELFPISLTPLEFLADETETNYFTATASFMYTIYNIFAADGRTPL